MPDRGSGKGFSGRLLAPPQPLPDVQPDAEQPGQPEQAEPIQRPAAGRTQRQRAQQDRRTPPPMPPAATTIRLRPTAAEPLNAAWLNERRMRDPKLSYPEFASMIVRLGLEAWEKQGSGR